jgi:polyhydroxyalkanoate synthase
MATQTTDRPTQRDDDQRAPGAPLDVLLTEASSGPARRFFPGRAGVEVAARLATRPDKVAKRTAGLAAELAKVAAGRSEMAPPKGDRRFKDPAWSGNPVFRRIVQSYLATVQAADALVCDADAGWRAERRVRYAVDNVLDALAPSNFPQLNPAVYKATLDTGGRNFVQGLKHLVSDLSSPPRIPSMVDTSAFQVGEDLALTPGEVVLRAPMFELIQYRPSTPKVRERPLLVVPPMINKFYVTDLAPGRSMIEFLVSEGQQVFTISWRNPDERHAGWGLDEYAGAVLEALGAVESITEADAVHAVGLCAGGITLSCAAAHLAASGDLDRLATMSLLVCVLDNQRSGTASALVDEPTAQLAVADSARRGYLDGRALAGVFAWLRPNDLIWNYWVNNYLLGKEPPAFDILYWNADTTRMPAALHRDFMRVSLENPLVEPGRLEVLGTPVDLGKVTVDSYLVAGIADHITPWENCYRSTQLLGSESRFVLSTSGHIAAMVNPPDNPKASYQTADSNPPDAKAWLQAAATRKGSWWTDWAAWLGERAGGERDAPARLGGDGYEPVGPGPGEYVCAT